MPAADGQGQRVVAGPGARVVAGRVYNVTQSSLAIVLRWRPYGESDKIVTLFTRDFGKLTGIGKGAVRSKRRFANSLEPLARIRILFRQRPNASLAFLESADLLAPLAAWADPTRFTYGSYLTELTDQLTVEDQPASELFDLLEEALMALENGPATGMLLRAFELKLLARAGFGPCLDLCAVCESPFPSGDPILLHAAHGTFLCAPCARRQNVVVVEVAQDLLSTFARLVELPLASCREQPRRAAATDAAELTGRLLALHLHRPLRSVKLIRQLGADSI